MTMEPIILDYDEETAPFSEELEQRIRTIASQFMGFLNVEGQMVTILFCCEETIRDLNHEFRGKDKPTDILSWSYLEPDEPQIPGAETPLGELVLCTEICQKQADAAGWGLETELIRLLAHGFYHIMGFDHETEVEEAEMLAKEKELLQHIGFTDLYD